MPFVIWISFRYGRRNRPASQEVQQRIAELTAEAEENIGGVRVVKAFAQEDRQLRRFDDATRRVFDQSMVSTRLRAFYSPFIGFLPQLGLAALLFVGGKQVIDGQLSEGDFVAFYGYVLMLTSPDAHARHRARDGPARRGQRRARLRAARPRAAPDRAGGRAAAAAGRRARRAARRRRSPTTATSPCCAASTSRSSPGSTVAIVGPTGSGKTTLVMLIPRLYDVDEGAVLVDGADVRDVDPASLRREVAIVSDDAFLFSASLRDNIAYARPEAGDDEVVAAAERAGLAGLLEDLPDGLDTLVGERGLTLSGGQRQRVAIARALLAEPRILILDDATSSVDATTESQIKSALAEVMEGRTTFVIAHRLSTIALADEVVVLEDGRVAARGTHAELLERVAALPRDRREGAARPGLPHARGPGARGGGAVRSRRLRPPRGACCGPTAGA